MKKIQASILGIILPAVLVTGCVTPKSHITSIVPNSGSVTGGIKIGLAKGSIAFDYAKDNPVPSPRVVISSTGPHFEISPKDKFYTETVMAPTYFKESTLLKTLSVEVIDKRVTLVSDIVDIVGLIGGDLTFIGRNKNCSSISSSKIKEAHDSLMGTSGGKALTEGKCTINAEISKVDNDAVLLTEFKRLFVDQDNLVTDIVPSPVCRTWTIKNIGTASTNTTLRVPDENYVRLSKLPSKGKLDFSDVCAIPSVTAESTGSSTDLSAVKDILELFQNEKEAAATN